MGRRRLLQFVLSAVVGSMPLGCYDSRWGQQEALQRQHAAKSAPTLGVEDGTQGEKVPSSSATRPLRVRFYVTRAYTTQVVDLPRTLRELLDDANGVVGSALAAQLELEGIRQWDLGRSDDLHATLAELRTVDPGADVDWVVGLVGGLSRLTASFHELGIASMPGRHVVLRAPTDALQHDDVERSYSELSADERRALQKAHRRHRSAAVFLHEIGHGLGSPHERSDRSLMHPTYRRQMTAYGPSALAAMRAVLERRDGKGVDSELASYRSLGAAVREAPDGAFFEEERRHLLDEVDRLVNAHSPPPPAAKSAPSAAPSIVDVPELTPEDRTALAAARKLVDDGDAAAAWHASKSLYERYPDVLAVQDFRCNLATRVFSFERARRECDRLMDLARRPR